MRLQEQCHPLADALGLCLRNLQLAVILDRDFPFSNLRDFMSAKLLGNITIRLSVSKTHTSLVCLVSAQPVLFPHKPPARGVVF